MEKVHKIWKTRGWLQPGATGYPSNPEGQTPGKRLEELGKVVTVMLLEDAPKACPDPEPRSPAILLPAACPPGDYMSH